MDCASNTHRRHNARYTPNALTAQSFTMCFAIVLKDIREYTRISPYELCYDVLEDDRSSKEMANVKVGDKVIGFQAHLKGLSTAFKAQTELRNGIRREIYEIATTEYWVRLDCEKGVIGDPVIRPVWRKDRVKGERRYGRFWDHFFVDISSWNSTPRKFE